MGYRTVLAEKIFGNFLNHAACSRKRTPQRAWLKFWGQQCVLNLCTISLQLAKVRLVAIQVQNYLNFFGIFQNLAGIFRFFRIVAGIGSRDYLLTFIMRSDVAENKFWSTDCLRVHWTLRLPAVTKIDQTQALNCARFVHGNFVHYLCTISTKSCTNSAHLCFFSLEFHRYFR